ncbi:hypothetical protein BJV78DRAFT_436544 [Lactifluus subvellereus]|nr:hypothetical protein BJV78DRAFT_436544 [Lactifluus subvellereus]
MPALTLAARPIAFAFVAALAVLATVPIVVALVSACTDDDNPPSHPPPSTRHHETTRLLHQPPTPPSHVRNYSSRILPYAGQSRQTLPASTRTQASHQPPPVPAAQIENVEDVNTAKDIRERAQRQHREMCNARARAKSAHKRGDYAAERTHKQEVIARKSAMDQLNTRAAEIIFKQKNKGRKQGMVDFHGLYVHEAVRYAKQELESASRRDDGELRWIVGKGLHAEDGEPKIRPALVELCKKRGLTCSLDPGNAGMLIVQVG